MALAIALLIWVLAIAIVFLFYFTQTGNTTLSFPTIATNFSDIDSQFYLTLIITGIAFLLSHLILGYFIFKYRDKNHLAKYIQGSSKLEIGYGVGVGIIFISLAIMSQKIWSKIYFVTPKNFLSVEASAEQFRWIFRHPGKDAKFGEIDLRLINKEENPLGLNPKDPSSRDDIVKVSELVIPVDEPVKLTLNSHDVMHSFFLPNLRIKQDAIPSLQTSIQFQANKIGEYEIACAELCGKDHYRMKAKLIVVSKEDFSNWLNTNTIKQVSK